MKPHIARILQRQAKRYLSKGTHKTVVVSGSVGKTSTTQAIATILGEAGDVLVTRKNYNTDIGVPCSIFEQDLPKQLKNPLSWAWIIIKNNFKMFRKPEFEYLILEIGTDHPGELAQFSWLKPTISVVTAVAAEHMEFFKTLDAVAAEEISPSYFSDITIVNQKMVDKKYFKYADTDTLFHYDREDIARIGLIPADLQVVGAHSIDAIAAGIAVGKALNITDKKLVIGAKKVRALSGRMQLLVGIKDSVIIDDSYNSSPEALKAAIDYLMSLPNSQRILLLGNMNELGESSAEAHKEIGDYCNPKKLDLVVTLGRDANAHAAPAAEAKGCLVVKTASPYVAAAEIKKVLKPGAAVLLKGSQNGVFAEEAAKELLKNPEDVQRLVRQSDFWMAIKRKSFKV